MNRVVVYLGDMFYDVKILEQDTQGMGAGKLWRTLSFLIVGASLVDVDAEGPILILKNEKDEPIRKVQVARSRDAPGGVEVDADVLAM